METNHKSFWPKRFSWLTIILAILTVVTFFAIYNKNGYDYVITPMGTMGGGAVDYAVRESAPPMMATPEMQANYDSSYDRGGGMIYPYPYPNPEVPVSDTREFLKTYYSSYMRTRNVQKLTNRVETVVRGYEGRIDNQSSSAKYGSVSFAMPKEKFSAFRAELESLVGSKFITVNISSQNLLSQKVSVEEQQKQADKNLADYKTERQKFINSHNSTVATLQAKIDKANADLVSLRSQTETAQILAQIKTISDDLAYQKRLLDNENTSYKNQLSSFDSSVKYAEDWKKAVQTQDKTLLENVGTVTGTVSVQWISLWDTVLVYLPGYSLPIIFAVLTLISFAYDRRRLGVV